MWGRQGHFSLDYGAAKTTDEVRQVKVTGEARLRKQVMKRSRGQVRDCSFTFQNQMHLPYAYTSLYRRI